MSDRIQTPELFGRNQELNQLLNCLSAKTNILVEGPVGVGKTHLALKASEALQIPFFRVDGDGRYTEGKLVGWFDPPQVMKSGYTRENFIAGPLMRAMESGGLLFINELNRMPEGVQNILLPVMDEGILEIPRIGTIHATDGFSIIATQNPTEFVATSPISEALFDRFELIMLDHLDSKTEKEIVTSNVSRSSSELIDFSISLMRATRKEPTIRRGASIRAAISFNKISSLEKIGDLKKHRDKIIENAVLSYSSRVEPVDHTHQRATHIIRKLADDILSSSGSSEKKK